VTTDDEEIGNPSDGPDADKLKHLLTAMRAIDIDVLLSEEAWR